MYDPKSPFNGAHLSELAQDPADHDHLDAWLAHLHGYTKIQHGPYNSTHGMNHTGWHGQHPKQARRVAIPNYTVDYNQLMSLLYETHARLKESGCPWTNDYIEGEPPTKQCALHIDGPDEKNRWAIGWYHAEFTTYPLVTAQHFELPVAIATAIITALEGQRAALSNVVDFARPSAEPGTLNPEPSTVDATR
ncbi:MAG: hypothetical protein IT367_18070 [Candidatus Hydrogenedentes bacterium]|nr:hypothetical protein [Candidatus Hydrogenedentota bacterium]